MFKPFALYIGTRYTNLKKRDQFITFISVISMIGIALGVMVLITVLSVMNGFTKEIRERILTVSPQLVVSGYGNPISDFDNLQSLMMSHPQVESVGPYVEGQGMMMKAPYVNGVAIKGIEPESVEAIFPLKTSLIQGDVQKLTPGRYGVILGSGLARSLGASIGSKVTLVIPEVNVTLVGAAPRLKQLEVIGIFEVGYVFDSGLAFLHMQDAQKIYRVKNGVSGVQAKLSDPFVSFRTASELRSLTDNRYYVTDWTELNATYFSAVKMEKRMMFLTLMLILAIAVFNLISTLVMVVTDKRSDIAILRTMGASKRTIMNIFISQGAVIGVVGTGIGVLLGITLALNVEAIVSTIEGWLGMQFLAPEIYFLSKLPSDLHMSDVSIIASCSLALSLVATIIPAYRATKVEPAQALKHEH